MEDCCGVNSTPLRKLSDWLHWLPFHLGYREGPRLMSALRKRWVLLRHPHAEIRFGRGVYLGPRFSLHMPGEGAFIDISMRFFSSLGFA